MAMDELTVAESETSEGSEQKPPRSGLVAGIAVLLALGALALSGLIWWEGRDTQPQVDPQIAQAIEELRQSQAEQSRSLAGLSDRVNELPSDDKGAEIANLESALSDSAAESRDLRSELATQQTYTRSLQQAIESLQARLMVAETSLAARAPSQAGSKDQFNLAGVDYLLRLAPERLSLFHDVRAADDALASADAQLAAMDNPVYLGLRQHISEARQLLAGTDLPNPIEISADLDGIQNQLAALTFGGESAAREIAEQNAADNEEQGWWDRLKSSLSGLVTVRRSADDADSRLTIEDKDLLRQGLWMQVEGARLALMRRDQASWDDTLSRAQGVLDQWFDASSEEFQSVSEQLLALSAINISPELPDISGPWAQLQLIRQVSTPPVAPAENVAEEPSEATVEEASDSGESQGEEPVNESQDVSQEDEESS